MVCSPYPIEIELMHAHGDKKVSRIFSEKKIEHVRARIDEDGNV